MGPKMLSMGGSQVEHVNRDCSFFAFLASSRDVEGFCCFIDSTLDSKVFFGGLKGVPVVVC